MEVALKRSLLGLFIVSCAKMSWVEYPITTAPDRACRVGVESVTDYYIWDCLNNEHIVVYQFGNYFGPTKPKKEVSACGTKTSIEQRENLAPGCQAPPDKFEWNAAVNKRGRVSR
jgi:hypothetical protein